MTTVALALGSGGARGMAHIGVIEWLEEHGFEIVNVAGSSIGALIGGMYAAGKLPEYRDWVCGLERSSVLRMLDISFSRSGLFKGERIIGKLSQMTGDTRIEDLAIPFTAVATDITRERSVWLNSGSLFSAIRSSIAVPTVFTPHHHMGRWLVDGGLVDPVPVAATRSVPADLHLAVNLNYPARDLRLAFKSPESAAKAQESVRGAAVAHDRADEDDDRPWFSGILDNIRSLHHSEKGKPTDPEEDSRLGMVDVLFRSLDIMQAQITETRLAAYRPDVVINVERGSGGFFDYDRARELIDIGYRLTDDALGKYLPDAQKPEKS